MNMRSTRQVGELLQVSCDTVERMIKLGLIQAERVIPRGRYRICEESVLTYAQRQQITLKQPQLSI